MVCPQGIPTAYPDIRSGGGYPPELLIRNYEVWLDWWAHQLDTPHWWADLTTIPNVENPKRLAQKIHAFFLILAVRCAALPGQEFTMPHASKCLTMGRFLPDDPSYQDVWQQPLLLTVAYAWALQYWVEKTRPPALLDYCPLVMSVVELMQYVRGHVTLNRQDIFWNLGRITLGTVSWDTVIPQGDPATPPTTTDARDVESNSTEAWGHMTPPIIQTSTQGGNSTSWTHCLAYQGWCWAYSAWHHRHSTEERCHCPFNCEPDVEIPKDLLTGWATALSRWELRLFPTLAWWLN